MRKIVINRCWGGYSVSDEAVLHYNGLRTAAGLAPVEHPHGEWMGGGRGIARDDPHLVETVEALGEKANGPYAELAIVEIPDGIDWYIDEYDGMERVAEKHRSWS